MTKKELKEQGIEVEVIDNGYRVAPTYKYIYKARKTTIVVDKDDYFGTKSYVMEFNGNDVKNFYGRQLRWHTLAELHEDMLLMIIGKMPIRCFALI